MSPPAPDRRTGSARPGGSRVWWILCFAVAWLGFAVSFLPLYYGRGRATITVNRGTEHEVGAVALPGGLSAWADGTIAPLGVCLLAAAGLVALLAVVGRTASPARRRLPGLAALALALAGCGLVGATWFVTPSFDAQVTAAARAAFGAGWDVTAPFATWVLRLTRGVAAWAVTGCAGLALAFLVAGFPWRTPRATDRPAAAPASVAASVPDPLGLAAPWPLPPADAPLPVPPPVVTTPDPAESARRAVPLRVAHGRMVMVAMWERPHDVGDAVAVLMADPGSPARAVPPWR